MNNKIYLMAAILAFASVGALFTQPILATENRSMIENILDSALPTNNDNNNDGNGNDNENSPASTNTGTRANPATASSEGASPTSTSLSCGQVVRESVTLSANLECSTDGLIAGANGITIDLNGFTIAGPGGESSKVGIMLANNDNVQVTGGTVKGFQAGVLNTGGSGNTISKVTFTENQIAIFNTGAKNTNIETNNMFSNSIGVASHSSTGTQLHQNMLTDNQLAGVTLVNSAENVLDFNTITGSVNGVFLDGQSTNNNVNTNTIVQNSGVDINNGNGLPTNINANIFTDNLCHTSVPDGLCIGR
ncbi:MAG TPA: right-handed parallel beta-helix repeat-containing protein [Phototrophicaceae bacterium]|nr:right-handed parallel beta-helix repeat-containing protein [Phototrophicaceae bacterium]